jgi:thymidine kinase
MSKLYFRYGSMSSGKSAYLLQAAHNYEESGKQVLIAKPSVDTKAGQMISSRIGISRNIDFIITPDMNVFSTFNEYNQEYLQQHGEPIAALLVDESQFLTKKQVDELLKVSTLLNVPVLCFGIRSDFATNGFAGSDRLLQVAHSLEEMKTICASCGRGKATLNARKVDGKYVFTGEQVAIDVGSDSTKRVKTQVSYDSLCSACYLKFSEGKLGD